MPSSIINKSGKLTGEEYDVVKQHPSTGAEILEKIDEYPYLSIGAHYHHEHYDGSGYPKGLKGDQIPEFARIISVADAYDAMTSIRSYRDPIPQDKVREQIVMGAGTQFDPRYARLMLDLIDTDTEYEMKERVKSLESEDDTAFIVSERRSAVTPGILINRHMTTVRMMIGSDDEATGIAPVPTMILFDSLDGLAHSREEEIKDRLYFEYGEIWFDGRTETDGARKMQATTQDIGAPDIRINGEYKIEAVRIKDHALIRVYGKKSTVEVIVALPNSTSFHTQSLPTARLVWHCPSVDLFCSDDGRVFGRNYRELAYIRLDGESRECDPDCSMTADSSTGKGFTDWDAWKEFNRQGYDVLITFRVDGNRITVQTENGGISVRNTITANTGGKKICAAITGDQVALTGIRIS